MSHLITFAEMVHTLDATSTNDVWMSIIGVGAMVIIFVLFIYGATRPK